MSAYTTWINMRRRCNSPSNPYYKWYGARGISICKRWDNFSLFLEDMGEKPDNTYSLDRINNDGNYEPNNCRWASREEQARNRRPRSKTYYKIKNGTTGTDWSVKQKKWRARIKIHGKETFLGYFETQEKAHLAYLQMRQNQR